MRWIFQCLFYWILFAGVLYSQPKLTRNYAYRYFTSRDGLVQMQVLCAFQDKDGYMWFGTKGGVSRFDGISFKNFTNEDGLPDGDVRMIGECGGNCIAFYTKKIALIDGLGKVKVFDNPDQMLFENHKYGCLPLNENEVLLLNLKKHDLPSEPFFHYIFNVKQQTFKRVVGFNDRIEDFNHDFVLTNRGIYSRIGLHFKLLVRHRFNNTMIADWKRSMFYFHNNAKTCIEIFHLDNTNRLIPIKILPNVVQDRMIVLPDGSLLYCINGFNPAFEPERQTTLGVNTSFLEKYFVDKEGNVWATTNNGLYLLFTLTVEEVRLGLAEVDNIWSIMEDKNRNMWFGSYGCGLWKYDKYQKLTSENRKSEYWKDQYFGACKTKSGVLYFTSAGGLTKYENGRFVYLGKSSACLSSYYDEEAHQIYYSGCDSATYKRGVYVDYGNRRKFYGWNKGYPQSIIKDANGVIRVGSFQAFGRILDNMLLADTICKPYSGIISMALDSCGRLWKGTNKGVYVEYKNGEEIQIAPEVKGCVTSLLNYHNRYLIVGTDNILVILNIDSRLPKCKVLKIPYEGGYTGLESGTNGLIEDHNGDVWMTTAMTVLKFNPDKLYQSKSNLLPTLRIGYLFYSKDNAKWKSIILTTQSVKLGRVNQFLRFEFIANSMSSPKSLRFRYRLLGFSDKWSDETFTKSVNYTNLTYGNYRLEVQCSLDGVHWSKSAITPEIVVLRPIGLRWYFVASYILIAILFVAGLTRLFVRRNQRKKIDLINRQKLENELQLKTLQSKIIPHFTKNVLSAIGYLAMTDRVMISHYIAKFSRFTGLTLENADKNYNSLRNEIEYIENYLELEKLRFGERFEFSIQVDPIVNLDILVPAMALHTYCDNAIRHGLVNNESEGRLLVEILQKVHSIVIRVSDNGVGRKKAKALGTRGNGQGLSLIQAQLDFYNKNNKNKILQQIKDVYDDRGGVQGTVVELVIPLDYSFEK